MDESKVDLTIPFRSREIFKLQSFPDVTVTQMCGSSFGYDSIKTKAHICINELACHRGYFVGLHFRKIILKREEQKRYFCSLGPHLEKTIKMFTYDDQTSHGVSTTPLLRVYTCHMIHK